MWFTHLFSSHITCFPAPACTGLLNVAFSDVAQLTCGVVHGSGAVECGFRGHWSLCAGRCPCYVWLSSLLGGHGHLLGICCGGSHLLGGGGWELKNESKCHSL